MDKKLIEYGHDAPSPRFAAEHLEEMEHRPFDGVMIRPGEYGKVFLARGSAPGTAEEDIALLGSIKWRKFTDNFVMMYAGSDMDWFSEEDWSPDGWVLRNVGLCAKAARAGGCVGLVFDAEPYAGRNPWLYAEQPGADVRSFAEFRAMVRRRGAQFLERIQEEFPAPVLHTFFLLSAFPHVALDANPDERERRLQAEYYGLLAPFLEGMLEFAGPGTVITDGNEEAYYYDSALRFLQSFCDIRQSCQAIIDPGLRSRYRSHVQCSQALYVDYLCNLRIEHTPGAFMTARERARWVEHNVYWALRSCDAYTWIYCENMNWWTGEGVPPELEGAVASAREKVARHEPLGFDIAPFIERANRDLEVKRSGVIRPRSARVPRLAGGEAAPRIDGRIQEEVWRRAPTLEFVPFLISNRKSLEARTRAWVICDDRHLYLAARCEEPDPSAIVAAQRAEERVWGQDWFEIVLAPAERRQDFRHIAINPKNVCWFGRGGRQARWNAECRTAVFCDENCWCVEAAIPWSAMEMGPPSRGARLAANLIRRRGAHREYSSWSQQRLAREPEPENLGTWLLA